MFLWSLVIQGNVYTTPRLAGNHFIPNTVNISYKLEKNVEYEMLGVTCMPIGLCWIHHT